MGPSVTCPSSSTGTEVFAQQTDRDAGLLDRSGLLKAQSSDGLHEHEFTQTTTSHTAAGVQV